MITRTVGKLRGGNDTYYLEEDTHAISNDGSEVVIPKGSKFRRKNQSWDQKVVWIALCADESYTRYSIPADTLAWFIEPLPEVDLEGDNKW